MRGQRSRARALTAALVAMFMVLTGMSVGAMTAAAANIGVGRTATASSSNNPYNAPNISDGDQATYWESAGAAYPQWAQIDLGATHRVAEVRLKLPTHWERRTQTLSVLGSLTGSGYTTLAASATHVFDPADGNTVTIPLHDVQTRYVRVEITDNTGWGAAQLSELEVHSSEESGDNLATAATLAASSSSQGNAPGAAKDGDRATFWQSAGGFPQWLRADLGSSRSVNRVVLRVPTTWSARTQTLKIQASDNGTTFTDLTAEQGQRFDNASGGNSVTLAFDSTTTRYIRVLVSANTGYNGAQIGELEIYGSPSGDTQAPTAPGNLALTEPSPGQIRLTWSASTDDTGVAGYDIYVNDTLRSRVAGNATSYTDTQPTGTTLTYYVRARDAAGNQSPNSASVTRRASGSGDARELAQGKPITASSYVHTFIATNANDGDVNTYWEGGSGAWPGTLTVQLGPAADLTSLTVRLNPGNEWGPRTQRFAVLGRATANGSFTTLVPAADYAFSPATGNSVTVPVSGRATDVRLSFTANTGAPAGQVAELLVHGEPAPAPDLDVSAITADPATPLESDDVELTATVRNTGPVASPATQVTFLVDDEEAATATVPAIAAGATVNVGASVGELTEGSHTLAAEVDPENAVSEQNEANNTFERPAPLVVEPVPSSDLVVTALTSDPSTPSAGDQVTFSARLENRGTLASAGGAHPVTLTLVNSDGQTVRTQTGTFTGALAPGATSAVISLGNWTAANGSYTLTAAVAADANEIPVKRQNNTTSRAIAVGRGAHMPYTTYEAEDGRTGGGATVIGPSRDVGHLAGEASGRRAVTLDATGEYVEFTTRGATNTLVTRFSIPDAPGGGGINSTINVYVNGQFRQALPLTSRYAWLYGNEASPGNSPSAGGPRHIYDEANLLFDQTIPAGSTIRLQKDAANTSQYTFDFIDTEQVSVLPNPDPARYVTPAGFGHQDVQNALDRVRMDTTGTLTGVYLPPGDYQTSSKFQVYGKPVQVVGAGVWYTRFHAPSGQSNTDIGFRAEQQAAGSRFAHFAYFGNYDSRIDGPGKVFDFSNVADIEIDDIWNEHMVCLYWGANTDRVTISNSRIRNMFADGVNMTNGSTHNHVTNNDARATGDDSFALFSAIDAGGADEHSNVYENLTSTLTWRAAGIAVYGGYDNVFRNIRVADTLVYSGITISSLDFGYPMNGFGTTPTRFENITIERAGGHFWGDQVFPGIWLFSASKVFQGIRISDVDIIDPTYVGIMFQTNYVGGQPQNPVTDTVLTDVTITGARRSGDRYDHKSGIGVWANEMPEPGQGPAVGSATFDNLTLSGNAENFRNTTSTFRFIVND
ncbi:discoidin domain-containing protein [Streptomyces sp. MS19]|uniref:discoidin domain-containing protein n=1 Tax=Streptomyces sp. MS19 TaxID=3385972 RepID=UPI0039A18D56